MIDVFKKHEKHYQRIVRKFAIDVWKERATKETYSDFYKRVFSFRKKYERDLVEYYAERKIKIYYGTIKEKADQWEKDQRILVETIQSVSDAKKGKIKEEVFDNYIKIKSPKMQKLLNDLYLTDTEKKAGTDVYRVYSFSENLLDKSEQLASQSAFDLGKDINHEIISENGEKYKWQSQEDNVVRKTHRKLNGKTFLYSDPPTTVDKYGRRHTGHPGTDWGCRCYEMPSNAKPLSNYIVTE